MENQNFLHKLENINEQLNLTHYWILLLKYKKIFFLAPILFALLGYFVALNINPVFQSQATLVIEESTKNIVNIEEVYSGENTRGFGGSSNYINNQIQILESDEVIGSILLQEDVIVKAEALYKKIPKNFLLSEKVSFLDNIKFLGIFLYNASAFTTTPSCNKIDPITSSLSIIWIWLLI